jgi:hypothetical protein
MERTAFPDLPGETAAILRFIRTKSGIDKKND